MTRPHGVYNDVVLNPTLQSPVPVGFAASTSGSGHIASGVYGVVLTAYSAVYGQSVASAAQTVTVTTEDTLTVTSPVAVPHADGWYAYMTQPGGDIYTLQQTVGSPTPFGTNLVLSVMGAPTSTGPVPPTSAVVVTGYVNDVPALDLGTHVGPF